MSLAVHRGQDPHTPAPAKPSNVDRSFVARRLQKNAATLVAAHSRSEFLGPDELVENFARAMGFKTTDLAILRIGIGPARHTLVCVPERVWHGGRKHDLLELKRIAGHAGRSCVLVPEAAIQRQPRLATSRVIEDATGVQVSLEQRMEVLIHLIERGSSTLFDCACAMNHPSPFSAILHLVAIGVVKMKSDSTLSPETKIELPDRLIGAAQPFDSMSDRVDRTLADLRRLQDGHRPTDVQPASAPLLDDWYLPGSFGLGSQPFPTPLVGHTGFFADAGWT